MKRLFLAATVLLASLTSMADEGMWMLNKIDPRTADVMRQLGLTLTPEQLYSEQGGTSLKDAVVDFGDFCSGVVVSPNGLVFTNHHCGFSAIQALSSTERDLLKDGFVAHSYSEELPAPDLHVLFLDRTEDVTAQVRQAVSQTLSHTTMTDQKVQQELIPHICDSLEHAYEEANPHRVVRLQPYYSGNEYYVSIYKMFTDIRLVFTPTQTLGKFGGDTDNWMWPRQTCDFSVFRIYTDANGEPADYNPANVPLYPKRWAKVSIDGYVPGDYCMTIGYPGSTDRYLSSYGITERMEQQNKPRIEVRGLKQDIWTRWMRQDRAVGIKYASKFASSSNYWKNSIGMNKALTDLNVVGQKQQLEQQIRGWYKADAALNNRFSNVFPLLEENYQKRADLVRTNMYFNETNRGFELFTLMGIAEALATSRNDEEKAYNSALWDEYVKDFDARVDEEVAAVLVANYEQKVDTAYHPAFFKRVHAEYGGDWKAFFRDIYSRTVLVQPNAKERILKLKDKIFDDPVDALLQDGQMVQAKLRKEMMEYRDNVSYGEQLLTQALLEMQQDQPHYSDANFSMRVSYGNIQDYTAAGQHFPYYTNAQSLIHKVETGTDNPDYEMEGDILQLLKQGNFGRYADKQTGDMHLCFLSNNDITGGNSGSPMFNGRGELIGLAFDGNWEAMSGDISFDSNLQRCIGVDIRFVLYLIDKWGHADNLLREIFPEQAK